MGTRSGTADQRQEGGLTVNITAPTASSVLMRALSVAPLGLRTPRNTTYSGRRWPHTEPRTAYVPVSGT